MKLAIVCGHQLVVPDNVAAWDAVAGDSDWEKPRLDSMLSTMGVGDVMYDVGAEHGWMSALLGQHVGGRNMVLIEPTKAFWPNIRRCFEQNELGVPLACAVAFAGLTPGQFNVQSWPVASSGPEAPAMAYEEYHPWVAPTVAIDWMVNGTVRGPDGITIDVEGHELRALLGAEQTLMVHRPHVWVSVHDNMLRNVEQDADAVTRLFAFMAGLDYEYHDLGTDHEHHCYFEPR